MFDHTSLPCFGKAMLACIFVTAWLPLSSLAQASSKTSPWSNSALSPGERARLVLKEMTLDEKIALVHGMSGERPGLSDSNGGATPGQRCGRIAIKSSAVITSARVGKNRSRSAVWRSMSRSSQQSEITTSR
jgi:hypothetical protein